jgi:hypothetical protein
VLTEPACWTDQDHASPLGTDAGLSILGRYLGWRKKHPRGKAISYLKAGLKAKGADDRGWDVVEPEAVARLLDDESRNDL